MRPQGSAESGKSGEPPRFGRLPGLVLPACERRPRSIIFGLADAAVAVAVGGILESRARRPPFLGREHPVAVHVEVRQGPAPEQAVVFEIGQTVVAAVVLAIVVVAIIA